MKKDLREKVLDFYKKCNNDITLTCKEFKGRVYPDTIKRWCIPELNEEAKKKSREYHHKMKDDNNYREKRKIKSREYRKTDDYKNTWNELYSKTKEKRKKIVKEHREKNLEHYNALARQNYVNNKERYRELGKKYYNKNKALLNCKELQRYHNDPITNLKHTLRVSLNRALQYGTTKNNKALKYLGCTIDEFKEYIESKFQEGMSWCERDKWHIDHIIPLTKIKDGYTPEQLCHYTNLRPLWSTDNLSKSDNIDLTFKADKQHILNELTYYSNTPGNYGIVPSKNKIVLTHQQHFYDYERLLWQDSTIKETLIQNRCYYLNKEVNELTVAELLRGFKISGIHYGYSHFSPLWFKKFIEVFNIKTVYDPCGGWGHRLLGTLGTSLEKYYYNDFDIRTVNGVKEIANLANIHDKVEFFNKRAEEFILPATVDAIFTCPPYYNKEIYNNTVFKNNDDFTNWWREVVSKCILTNCKYFAFVIDNDNANILQKPLTNWVLILEQQLSRKLSHFNKQQDCISKEILYVYKRP